MSILRNYSLMIDVSAIDKDIKFIALLPAPLSRVPLCLSVTKTKHTLHKKIFNFPCFSNPYLHPPGLPHPQSISSVSMWGVNLHLLSSLLICFLWSIIAATRKPDTIFSKIKGNHGSRCLYKDPYVIYYFIRVHYLVLLFN